MNKEKKLKKIIELIKKCRMCRLNRKNTVSGEGDTNAKLFFVGESPGREEDLTGRPFIGRAGRLLTELLVSIKLKRENVFITSVLKCRPPNNRKPTAKEIEYCLPYLKKQIEIIKPKIIVLLGNTALQSLLGKEYTVTKYHGKFIGNYFVTFHPAAGIRFKKYKNLLFNDFKKLKNVK